MPDGFVHTAKHSKSLQQSDLVATARFQHVVGVSAKVKREPPRDRKGTNTALNNGGIMSPFAKQLFDIEVARMRKDAAIIRAKQEDYEGRQLNHEAFVDDQEQRQRDIEDRSEP